MPTFLYAPLLFATSVVGIATIAHLISQRLWPGRRWTAVHGLALGAGGLFWFSIWAQSAPIAASTEPSARCLIGAGSAIETSPFKTADRIVVGQGLPGGAVSIEQTQHGFTIRRGNQTITTDTRAGTVTGNGTYATCTNAQPTIAAAAR